MYVCCFTLSLVLFSLHTVLPGIPKLPLLHGICSHLGVDLVSINVRYGGFRGMFLSCYVNVSSRRRDASGIGCPLMMMTTTVRRCGGWLFKQQMDLDYFPAFQIGSHLFLSPSFSSSSLQDKSLLN